MGCQRAGMGLAAVAAVAAWRRRQAECTICCGYSLRETHDTTTPIKAIEQSGRMPAGGGRLVDCQSGPRQPDAAVALAL